MFINVINLDLTTIKVMSLKVYLYKQGVPSVIAEENISLNILLRVVSCTCTILGPAR